MLPAALSTGLRSLLAVCVAVAVIFTPAAARACVAFAAVPDHQMQMMEIGPCQMPSSGAADHRNGGKSCCISDCLDIAAAFAAPMSERVTLSVPPLFAVPSSLFSYPGELPTPPPKLL